MISLLSFDDKDFKKQALKTLRRITSEDFGEDPEAWDRWWKRKEGTANQGQS